LAWPAVELWRRVRSGGARRAWATAAKTFGGQVQPGAEGQLRIETAIGEVALAADGGGSSTTVVAPAPSAFTMTLTVLRPYHTTELADLLALRHHHTDDPRFDQIYEVHASDEGLGRAWLNGAVRRALLQAPGYRYAVDGGYATARRNGIERNPRQLVGAMRAVAELAAAGRSLGDRWRDIASGIGGALVPSEQSLLGGSHIWLLRKGVPIVVDVALGGRPGAEGRPCACAMEADSGGAAADADLLPSERPAPVLTCVCGQVASIEGEHYAISHEQLQHDERFDLAGIEPAERGLAPVRSRALPTEYRAVSDDPNRTSRRIALLAAAQIAEVHPAAIHADASTVSLWWPGVMLSRRRLDAAVELVADLATCSAG